MTENDKMIVRYLNSLAKDDAPSWAMPIVASGLMAKEKEESFYGGKPYHRIDEREQHNECPAK